MIGNYQDFVRRLLLLSLDDSNRKICTAISMAVASIAVYDWPEGWPDLLPFLLKLMNDQRNMNGGTVLYLDQQLHISLYCNCL